MRLQVELLGGFRVVVDERPVPDEAWQRRRPAELVKMLALAEGHRLRRDVVVERLWPHLDVEAGVANLHKAAHHVRTAVGERSAVALTAGEVRLLPEAEVEVDVTRFEAAAADALQRRDAERCAEAADRYAGELLPGDADEPWITELREHLRRLHRELLRVAGRWPELAELEPTDEQAQRELMRRALDQGDSDDAIRRFRQVHRTLAELGLRPGLGTRALYEEAVAASRSPRRAPPRGRLYGRREELAAARKVLRAADTGAGGTVLIDGPAGIGKTRFGLALVDETVDGGWQAACSTATDADARMPYAPLTDAVEHLLSSRPDALHLLPPSSREVIAALTGASPIGRCDPSELLQALVRLLVAAAGSGVTLLFLDDVHAADEATLSLLRHLSNAIRFQPLVLLLAYRADGAPPPLAGLRDSVVGREVGIWLTLKPLDRDATRELARSSAGKELSEPSLTSIWELAQGNPLFTHELATAVAGDGDVDPATTLPEVLVRRLDALPAELSGALERAAIVGAAFDASELVTLVGFDRDRAVRLLRAGVDHGVLVRNGGRYRFAHALVREHFAAAVSPQQQAAIHAEVTDRLIAVNAPPARIAHHARLGRRRDAVHWFVTATESALEAGAYQDALRFADQGQQIAARAVPELLEARGDALLGLGDPTVAGAYRQAIEVAEERKLPALHIKQARALLAAGAIDPAAECVAGLSISDPDDHVRLLVVQALIAWYRDDPRTAAELTDQARHAALGGGSTREFCDVLALQVLAAHSAGQWHLASLTQWMQMYDAPPPSAMAIDPHLCVADYLLSSDQPTEVVVEFGGRMLDATTRSGSLRGRAFALVVLGQAELWRGRLDVADEHLRESRELHRRVGSVAGEAIASERLAERARLQGRPDEADRLLDQAAEVAPRSAMYAHLLPRIHATRIRNRDGDAARDAVREAWQDLADREQCPMCSIGLRLAATTVYARTGDIGHAREHLGVVELLGPVTHSGLLGAQLTVARAEVALASAETAEARRLMIDAAGWLDQLGHTLAVASCRERVLAMGRGLEAAP